MEMRWFTLVVLFLVAGRWCGSVAEEASPAPSASASAQEATVQKITKTEAEWRKELSPEQYEVLRDKGTERPFTGPYWNDHSEGTFVCAGCGLTLFESKTKFDSGTGWPSFYAPAAKEHVGVNRDASHGMIREEVVCARCDGHLGHVFPDGPKPTGLRYCINGISLKMIKKDEKK